LLAGDARPAGLVLCAKEVSIRARHCWRAMRPRFAPWGFEDLFQSAPAIAGGRCMPPKKRMTWKRGFNPRPPLLAGDA